MLSIAILAAALFAGSPVSETARGAAAKMAILPAGTYRPLYAEPGAPRIRVAAFALDRDPVTRGEFQRFVLTHATWRRDAIRPVFAEHGYLADWVSAVDPGAATLRRPVTAVSWFAARAYCAAQGKRLPTVDEWEYAAAASATMRDAIGDRAVAGRLLQLYQSRASRAGEEVGRGVRNAYGVRDLHEMGWEWTLDFNSVLVSDDSRGLGAGGDERDHHLFCASAALGASDPTNYAAFLRYAFRAGLTGRATVRSLGFRCAASAHS
ncbi:MAG: Sulphatase-modifying factor protein [Gemmatimonadetes bacterium]|jgi:sulfatase modifying factor 1|nr:Sulphatase-modifying factor protein [Gemmatimonadota bacterium]